MKYRRIPRIGGMAQEIGLVGELEAGRLDLLAQRAFLDAVQRLAHRRAVATARRMIGDDQKPPGFSAANILRFISARSTGM